MHLRPPYRLLRPSQSLFLLQVGIRQLPATLFSSRFLVCICCSRCSCGAAGGCSDCHAYRAADDSSDYLSYRHACTLSFARTGCGADSSVFRRSFPRSRRLADASAFAGADTCDGACAFRRFYTLSAFRHKLGRLCSKLGTLCLHTRFGATGMFSCLGKISLPSSVLSARSGTPGQQCLFDHWTIKLLPGRF
jgi:hypothetical protein